MISKTKGKEKLVKNKSKINIENVTTKSSVYFFQLQKKKKVLYCITKSQIHRTTYKSLTSKKKGYL